MNWNAVKSDGSMLVIDAERWFDARAYALAKLGEDVEVTASVLADPDVELLWKGSDFGKTGDRQLWVRERGKKWMRA